VAVEIYKKSTRKRKTGKLHLLGVTASLLEKPHPSNYRGCKRAKEDLQRKRSK
jgi:hypothetical protein